MTKRFRIAVLSTCCVTTVTSGCGWFFECSRGSSRELSMVATVGDTTGTISVGAWLVFDENRGNSDAPRQVQVVVQSVLAPIPPPAPAALVGHVSRARFELADGTVIFEMPILPPGNDEPSMVGFNFTNDMSSDQFAALRNQVVSDSVFVVLETDPGAPVMRRTPLHEQQDTGWRTIGCS